jgi:hypothetical protein
MARLRFSMGATTRQRSTATSTIPVRREHSERHRGGAWRPEVLGVEASSSVISVMGGPNRAPGVGIMGGRDRGVRLDVMGGADRGPSVDAMGGPDRGVHVDVMGQSDPGFVDSLFRGQTSAAGAL